MFREFVRMHRLALVIAVLAGLSCVAPHLMAVVQLGNSYEGIPFLYQDNEDYYLARIQEIYDGHSLVASPYYFEYKDTPPLIPPTGEWLFALVGGLFGTTLPHTLVIAKFLLPAFLFLLVYYLLFSLTRTHAEQFAVLAGLTGATLIVVGIGLIDYQEVFRRLSTAPTWPILSMWTRPVNPISGALFLFLFLNLIVYLRDRDSIAVRISAGILLAAMLGYIFSFGVALASLVSLWMVAFYFKQWDALKQYTFIGVIAFAAMSVYAFSVFSPGEGDSLLRNGVMYGHAPLLNKIVLAAIAVVAGMVWFGKKTRSLSVTQESPYFYALWFSFALLAGSFAALNQQIITGLTIWPHHLVQFTIPLAIVSVIVLSTISIAPMFPRFWRACAWSSIALCFAFSVWNASTYTVILEHFRSLQGYAPAFSWIRENASHDCVALVAEDAVSRFTNFIPSFTSCNVYHTQYLTGRIPFERVRHNYLALMYVRGVNEKDVEIYLRDNKSELLALFYADWKELFVTHDMSRIDALIPDIASEYRTFVKGDVKENLQKYRVEYVIDAGALAPNVPAQLDTQKVFDENGIRIYAL